MHRLGNSCLAAVAGAGASLLASAFPIAGQTLGQPSAGILRPFPPGISDNDSVPLTLGMEPDPFAPPTYGNPPGFGAGTTGFVSLGPSKRKAITKALAYGEPISTIPNAPPSGTSPRASGRRAIRQLVRRGAPRIDPPLAPEPSPIIPSPPPTAVPLAPSPILPLPRPVVVDLAPYDPLGLREGAFLIKPAIELTGGYDSNPQHMMPPQGSSEFVVAPEVTVRSDWERHALDADIHGSYTAYGSSFPDFGGRFA